MHHISHTAIWISNFFLGEGGSAERGEDCFAQARIQRAGGYGGSAPSPDPTPRPHPIDAFGASIRVPSALVPPDHISGYGPGFASPPAKIPAGAHAHLTLILLLHYLVKCRSRSLAVYNNEFIYTGSACVGSEHNCETKKSLKKRPSLCPHSH